MLLNGLTSSEKGKRGLRYVSFACVTLAIWLAAFAWRAPGAMLGLKHMEHLGRDSQEVAITFDDAPHPLTTPLLLAALKRTGVHGTFFVVGDGLRLYPELTRRIVMDGHHLGNHSQYHHNLTRISPADYDHEVETCFGAIRRAGKGTDWENTRLFRPPGGGMNRDVMDFLHTRGATLAWWSNNVGDWSCPPAWKIADTVKATLRPGDIILLHDAGLGTPQAIPAIVKEARKRGLSFIPMPEG